MALSLELRSRARLPAHVGKVLAALPEGTHPMTQFSIAVLALQVRIRDASSYIRAHLLVPLVGSICASRCQVSGCGQDKGVTVEWLSMFLNCNEIHRMHVV